MIEDGLTRVLEQIASGQASADSLEGERLEFKTERGSLQDTYRDLAEAAACLANTRGGVIIVGIDDHKFGEDAVVGCTFEVDRLRLRIWELATPNLSVVVESISFRGNTLASIRVQEGLEVHTVGGRATHRVGATCQPMAASEQALLVEERKGFDWSSEAGAKTVTDISTLAVEVARKLLRTHPDPERNRWADLPVADLLRVLGLADAAGTLTRAAELLFCSGGRDAISYQFKQAPGGDPTTIRRHSPPLLPAIERVLENISDRVERTRLLLPSGQEVELADLPDRPVREAVVNALAHRDWRIPDPVAIEQSPARLVVHSPGPLVRGVTLENILAHPSKPRNRALTEAIRKLGLAEQAGVGIDRMYRDMIRGGHDVPSFSAENYVRVALAGGTPNRSVARYVSGLPSDVAEDVDSMLVLFSFLSSRTATASTLSSVVQKPEAEVETVLKRLATDEIGMIEPTRATASRKRPTYQLRGDVVSELGTAVQYRRRTRDEIDRKIVTTVRELGQVTNRVVQLLFDVKVERASRILADLVERQILEKTSTNERGPGVTYGPGIGFPAKPNPRKKRDGLDENSVVGGQLEIDALLPPG